MIDLSVFKVNNVGTLIQCHKVYDPDNVTHVLQVNVHEGEIVLKTMDGIVADHTLFDSYKALSIIQDARCNADCFKLATHTLDKFVYCDRHFKERSLLEQYKITEFLYKYDTKETYENLVKHFNAYVSNPEDYVDNGFLFLQSNYNEFDYDDYEMTIMDPKWFERG